jgi:polyphosphate kinase
MSDPAGSDASTPTPATFLHAVAAEAARVDDPRHYINRELSWLAFNERVLDQARSETHPLLERVKFLAIAANNLDEFFMIRVATLTRQVRAGLNTLSPDGLTVEEQLTTVRTRAERMLLEIARCWDEQLVVLLADAGIHVIDRAHYAPAVGAYLAEYFRANLCPVLTPLAFDPGHPFPYISNRSNSFAVVVEDQGAIKFARVKVPDVLSRFIRVPPSVAGRAGDTFEFLEDVIRQNLFELFRGAQIRSAHLFRIIRDTDIVLREEGVEDLLESVDRGLKELRHGPITLLQTDADMPERVLNILVENFELGEPVVVPTSARLGFSDFMSLQIYTDLGLFTADDEIGADASELFNALTGYSRQVDYRALLVAPVALRAQITALVEREIAHAKAGVPAGIVIKNNSISDLDVVGLLYRASQAGVRVDAIVRGICCLRPGVPGVSDLIRVRSIIGRFLEHSRIYSFENAGDTELYIGSADLMERNLDRRVEALCPVLDPDIRRYLRYQLLQAYLRDDTRATMLGADGRYEPIHSGGRGSSVDAQQLLMSERPPEA